MTVSPSRFDRRTAPRGDQRRDALLAALDRELRLRPLDEIAIADLSRAAGVSRSAFYFYFDSKAAAVAALMAGVHETAYDGSDILLGSDGAPRERIEAALHRLFDTVEQHAHVYRAMLDARTSHVGVCEMWEEGRTVFVAELAGLVRRERSAGRTPDGPDAEVLASVLLQVNESALERVATGAAPPRADHIAAVAAVWLHTLHGVVPEALDPPRDPDSPA